jgi:hypothetical protein
MPLKTKDCQHQFAEVKTCAPAFRNVYECDNCDTCWEDEHSCGCDDECPACGHDISPTKSIEIAPCACEYL